MAVKQDFLNPKSMMTPGIAGGIVMMISNTLLIQFELPARWTALSLSALLGFVVFLAAAIPLWQRIIYYIFNSLIIFCIAVGSNRVASVSSSLGASVSSSVYASALMRERLPLEQLLESVTQAQSALQEERTHFVSLARERQTADEATRLRLNLEIQRAFLRIDGLEKQLQESQSAIGPRKWFDDWF